GGTIYYTTDGTDPDESSTEYETPIELSHPSETTIKAITIADGHNNSTVATGEFILTTPVTDAPTFSPEPGSYIMTVDVSLSSDTEGAIIYYTTDGTDPTTESSVYSGPLTFEESVTIKAFATSDGN